MIVSNQENALDHGKDSIETVYTGRKIMIHRDTKIIIDIILPIEDMKSTQEEIILKEDHKLPHHGTMIDDVVEVHPLILKGEEILLHKNVTKIRVTVVLHVSIFLLILLEIEMKSTLLLNDENFHSTFEWDFFPPRFDQWSILNCKLFILIIKPIL